jgi:hypothetical protein
MLFTPARLNLYTFFKLPSVWWCGVRVTQIKPDYCEVRVTHRWINQNPFRSMFWAVQGMAAELTTGILIMQAIKQHKKNISMLVLNNRANFSKKAKGKLVFSCTAEEKINTAFKKLIDSNTPQTLWLTSKGVDENQDIVSTFEFEWTLSLKNKI